MAKRRIDCLDDLLGISDRVRITCRECGRSGIYPTADIIGYFRSKRWSRLLAHATVRFRCDGEVGGAAGCGARNAEVRAEPKPWSPPPPAKPEPLPHPDERPRGSHRRR